MKNTLLESLNKEGLFSIWGMTSELGYTTKRTNLKTLSNCEDWLRNKPSNSIRLLFDGSKSLDFLTCDGIITQL